MNGLLITISNKTDLQLFTKIANKFGAKVTEFTDEELLDLGLLKAMEEGRNTQFVDKEVIMKKLKRNGNQI